MNPLVQALSKGKSSPGDYGGDLHTRKDSHLSAPMQGMEWHMSSGDLNMEVGVNQTYKMCIPVICTSTDDHDVRFRQIGKPYVEDEAIFKSVEPAPRTQVQTQEEHG